MREIVVDSFAGGGGASLGISWALGRGPDIAINHDAEAVALHKANHPETRHYREDVWKVDPVVACAGRRVGLMWLSPDCKHFSKAKGGKPVSPRVRGLAWVAIRWATAVRPRVIVLENVEEFQGWGPLLKNGKPDPKRKGLVPPLLRSPALPRLRRGAPRDARLRLRHADVTEAPVPHRPLRRPADRLAHTDARQGHRQGVPIGR